MLSLNQLENKPHFSSESNDSETVIYQTKNWLREIKQRIVWLLVQWKIASFKETVTCHNLNHP